MTYWSIGLMSGTSLDGVDVAAIRTDGETVVEFGICDFIAYPENFRDRLKGVLGLPDRRLVPIDLVQEITQYHIDAVKKILARAPHIREGAIIGFHGQTIHHDPDNKLTIQLGDGQMLADALELPVVYDFRSFDVENGGEGAPLAPVYHRALFKEAEVPVAVVNIGGVSNITLIDKEEIFACDLGPGNALMDDFVKQHFQIPFDMGGHLASQGRVDHGLLKEWLADPFFTKAYPKSLDRDAFAHLNFNKLEARDALATLLEFTVQSIALAEKMSNSLPEQWYITGGGRKNLHLMQRLSKTVQGKVDPIEAAGFDGDALEAEAFAFLARRHLKNLPISYPETTGVVKCLSGGVLAMPKEIQIEK